MDDFLTERIKEDVGDRGQNRLYGPAGEKMVSYALVNCEFNRHAGQGGAERDGLQEFKGSGPARSPDDPGS